MSTQLEPSLSYRVRHLRGIEWVSVLCTMWYFSWITTVTWFIDHNHVYVDTHICKYIYIYREETYIQIDSPMHIHIHMYMYTYIYMCVLYIYMHKYICLCLSNSIYDYMRT